MDRMTGVLIALIAMAALVVGGIIIVDTVNKNTQDAQVPSVNISRVYCVSDWDNIYGIQYDYYNFFKGQTIVFYVDSHEVYKVRPSPKEPSRQGMNFDLINPSVIPTLSNTTYTIMP